MRVCAPENVSSAGDRRAVRRRRKPERPEHEAIGERLEQAVFGRRELLTRERATRLAVPIRDLHTARIVDEHAEEVLLRHRRLDDQHRPEQAEEHEQQRRGANRREDDPMMSVGSSTGRPGRSANVDRDGSHDQIASATYDAGRGNEPEFTLLENDRPVIEEQPKERIEQCSSPPSARCAARAPIV